MALRFQLQNQEGIMPRIRPLTKNEISSDMQVFFESQIEKTGVVFNSTGIQAYCPPILKGMNALAQGIAQSGQLEPSLQRLLNLKAAAIIGCPF